MSKEDLYAEYDRLKSDLVFRKSSQSSDTGSCVEVADLPGGGKVVRDSLNPDRPALVFDAREWRSFILGAIAGDFC
jgi:hypothetical protein